MIYSLAWRSLWRNPRRTLVTLVTVTIGVLAILCFAALLNGWAESTRLATQRALTGSGQIHDPLFLQDPGIDHRMPFPSGQSLAALNGNLIAAWSTRVRLPAVVFSEYRSVSVSLVGVHPSREQRVSDIPNELIRGRYLSGPSDVSIVLGRSLLRRLKSAVGRRVVLMVRGLDGRVHERGFKVIGELGGSLAIQDGYAFVGIETLQSFAQMGTDISEIVFTVRAPGQLPSALRLLRSVNPKWQVLSWKELAPFAFTMSTLTQNNVALISMIIFVLIAIGLVNSQLMAVYERVREFALLQAVGMRPRRIALQVALESALIMGIGAAVGMGLAIALSAALGGQIDLGALGQGAERLGAARIVEFSVGAASAAGTCVWVCILGITAAVWPAIRASRSDPLAAMRAN